MMRQLAIRSGGIPGLYSIALLVVICGAYLVHRFINTFNLDTYTEQPIIVDENAVDSPVNNSNEEIHFNYTKVEEIRIHQSNDSSSSNATGSIPKQVPPAVELGLKRLLPTARSSVKRRHKRLRVIDGFIFNNELDLLEIRLESLFDVVDWFVIIESNITHQFTQKPLNFKNNQARFTKYQSKIIYYACLDVPPDKSSVWTLEVHHRSAIGSRGIKQMMIDEKKIPLRDEDLVLISDLDEIPRPEILDWLAWHSGYPSSVRFCMHWTLYGFMWRNPNTWCFRGIVPLSMIAEMKMDQTNESYATQAVRKHGIGNHFEEEFVIGNTKHNQPPAAGWHCSWCFPVSEFMKKTTVEVNLNRLRDYQFQAEQKRIGKWLLDKPGDVNPISRAPLDDTFAPKGWQTLWNFTIGENGRRNLTYLIDPKVTGDE